MSTSTYNTCSTFRYLQGTSFYGGIFSQNLKESTFSSWKMLFQTPFSMWQMSFAIPKIAFSIWQIAFQFSYCTICKWGVMAWTVVTYWLDLQQSGKQLGSNYAVAPLDLLSLQIIDLYNKWSITWVVLVYVTKWNIIEAQRKIIFS